MRVCIPHALLHPAEHAVGLKQHVLAQKLLQNIAVFVFVLHDLNAVHLKLWGNTDHGENQNRHDDDHDDREFPLEEEHQNKADDEREALEKDARDERFGVEIREGLRVFCHAREVVICRAAVERPKVCAV